MSPRRKKGSRSSDFSKYSSVEIEIDKGPGEGQVFDLDMGETAIGRADDCDIRIDCGSVSRRHAIIRRDEDSIVIIDEKSHNGTFVNEKEIRRPTKIFAGDRIQIGDSVLCLMVDGSRGDDEDEDEDIDGGDSEGLKTSHKAVIFFLTMAVFTSIFILVLPKFGNLISLKAPEEGTPAKSGGPAFEAIQSQQPRAGISTAPAISAAAANAVQINAQPVSGGTRPPAPVSLQQQRSSSAESPSPAQDSKDSTSASSDSPSYRSASGRSASDKRQSDSEGRDIDSRHEEEAERSRSSDGTRSRDEKRVRSLYIAGKVGAALELAENVGTGRLANQLRRFSKAESEAKAALASRKGTEAIQRYSDADAIDQEIISDMEYETESIPGKRVRRALSSLYQKAGEAYAAKGDKEHAADFLQRSLDYDKSNARSKKLLKALGPLDNGGEEEEDSDEDEAESDGEESDSEEEF